MEIFALSIALSILEWMLLRFWYHTTNDKHTLKFSYITAASTICTYIESICQKWGEKRGKEMVRGTFRAAHNMWRFSEKWSEWGLHRRENECEKRKTDTQFFHSWKAKQVLKNTSDKLCNNDILILLKKRRKEEEREQMGKSERPNTYNNT